MNKYHQTADIDKHIITKLQAVEKDKKTIPEDKKQKLLDSFVTISKKIEESTDDKYLNNKAIMQAVSLVVEKAVAFDLFSADPMKEYISTYNFVHRIPTSGSDKLVVNPANVEKGVRAFARKKREDIKSDLKGKMIHFKIDFGSYFLRDFLGM